MRHDVILDGIPVTVEVLLLSHRQGMLRYRVVSGGLVRGDHPDDLARHLSGLSLCVPGGLLHSTSWRLAGDTLVLTYAALPDPGWVDGSDPATGSARVGVIDPARVVLASGPLSPSPTSIDLASVALHACRHLALLASTDEVARQVVADQPEMWGLLRRLPPVPAGGLRPVPVEPHAALV